jgi:hypothetical protein
MVPKKVVDRIIILDVSLGVVLHEMNISNGRFFTDFSLWSGWASSNQLRPEQNKNQKFFSRSPSTSLGNCVALGSGLEQCWLFCGSAACWPYLHTSNLNEMCEAVLGNTSLFLCLYPHPLGGQPQLTHWASPFISVQKLVLGNYCVPGSILDTWNLWLSTRC